MSIFCQAVLDSLFRYGITVWFGYLSVQLKSDLMHLIQTAWKITVCENPTSLQAIFEQATLKQAHKIVSDPSHVPHTVHELLPCGKGFRVPHCKLNRLKD